MSDVLDRLTVWARSHPDPVVVDELFAFVDLMRGPEVKAPVSLSRTTNVVLVGDSRDAVKVGDVREWLRVIESLAVPDDAVLDECVLSLYREA